MPSASDLVLRILAVDQTAAGFKGAGKGAKELGTTVDKMNSAAGAGLSKLGGMLGGEVGHLVHTFGAGLEELGEHGMSMGKKFMAAGGMMAGLGTGLMLMGSADKQATDQLAQAIGNTGEAFSQFKEEVEVAIHAQENYGHSAVDTQEALRKMTQATDDPKKAFEMLGLASNLAAAQHITLSEAADKLDKILAGKGGRTLALYGIAASKTGDSVKDAEVNIDALSKKIDGQADASVDNFAAKFTILRVKVTDAAAVFGNTFGGALTAAGGAATLLGTILEFRLIRTQRLQAIAAAQAAAALDGEAVSAELAGTASATAAPKVAMLSKSLGYVAVLVAGIAASAASYQKAMEVVGLGADSAKAKGEEAITVWDRLKSGVLHSLSGVAPEIQNWVNGLFGGGEAAKAMGEASATAADGVDALTSSLDTNSSALDKVVHGMHDWYAGGNLVAATEKRLAAEVAAHAAAEAHLAHVAAVAHAAQVAAANAALATWNETITAYNSAKDALKALTDARANEIKAIGDQLTASGHLNSVFDMNAYTAATDRAKTARVGLADAEKAVNAARSDVGKAKTPEELNAAINAEAQANKALAASRAEVAAADKAKEAAKLTPGHLLSSIKSKLSNIKSFYNDLVALRKRKLPMSLIRQLIDAGPLEGDQLAKALLAATPADFNAIINAEAQLDQFGAKIGGIVGDYDYNGLIARQTGVVNTARANAVAAGNQVAQFRLFLDGRELAIGLKAYRASVGGAPLGLG